MVGGILLTGGASRRMGRDKATIEVDGTILAVRSASLLSRVTDLAVEVGDGVSGLASVREVPRGSGPLAACAAGHAELLRRGLDPAAPCLVIACDLPRLSQEVLEKLGQWPGSGSVMPVIDGFAQPLCARWSARDLRAAVRLLAAGVRSLRDLPDRAAATLLDEVQWGSQRVAFADVDNPEDFAIMGLGPLLTAPATECDIGSGDDVLGSVSCDGRQTPLE
jgi:molybdenum cofactor guanylyltransferase